MFWGGLIIDLAIAGFGFVAGMMIMGIASCKKNEDIYADAYKLGYEIGKKEGEKNGCKKVS